MSVNKFALTAALNTNLKYHLCSVIPLIGYWPVSYFRSRCLAHLVDGNLTAPSSCCCVAVHATRLRSKVPSHTCDGVSPGHYRVHGSPKQADRAECRSEKGFPQSEITDSGEQRYQRKM